MKKYIPEEIQISPCGSFCFKTCQFFLDRGEDKSFFCKKFNKILWDEPYASRPIRCEECCELIYGSSWSTGEGL